MKLRKEFDSLGKVLVPSEMYWGASTQRSKKYFNIGNILVSHHIVKSIAIIKKAAAITNNKNKDLEKKLQMQLLNRQMK